MSGASSSSSSSGIGLMGVLFILFLTLKLLEVTAVAEWSWWLVTLPLWGPVTVLLGLVAAFFLIKLMVMGGVVVLAWIRQE